MNHLKRSILSILAMQAVVDGTVAGNAVPATPVVPVLTKEQKEEAAKQAAEAQAAKFAAIKASFNNTVDVFEASFFFKTVKEKDDKGVETGVETKRPNIDIGLPVPSFEGLIEILSKEGKGRDLVMESIYNTVADQAREMITDDESITSANFPYEKCAWEYIAGLPKSERRGGGISQETWKEFVADYIATMPGPTGKSVETITKAANIFATKFNTCKSNKPVLLKLKGELAIYLEHTKRAEDFVKCVQFLDNKADNLLKIDESKLADLL